MAAYDTGPLESHAETFADSMQIDGRAFNLNGVDKDLLNDKQRKEDMP